MNGRNWHFSKYLPDEDDFEASNNSMEDFFALPKIRMNEGEKEEHIFCSAFFRGIKWAKDKYGIDVTEEGSK